MNDTAARISVIITTKNEEANIANCIDSIRAQSYPPNKIEIIVVDNNSTDKTFEISKRYTDKVYNCGPERSAQRNFGIKQSSGEYVFYLDADMSLSASVIAECVEKCGIEGCVALYIPERIAGKGFWARVRDFERSFYNATSIDCVRFVRKDKFLEVGGFDEELTGPEDWDFDRRIGRLGKVDIIKSVLFHNEEEFNFKKYLRKKAYYRQWFDKYIQKWGKEDVIVRKQLGFWYRYFGVFLERGKWRNIYLHPVLACSMYYLRITLGLHYLLNQAIKWK